MSVPPSPRSGGSYPGGSATPGFAGADQAGQRVALGATPLAALQPDTAAATLTVVIGQVWVTQAGDRRDHLLRAGQRFTANGPGMVVVQRLSPHAVVEVAGFTRRLAAA